MAGEKKRSDPSSVFGQTANAPLARAAALTQQLQQMSTHGSMVVGGGWHDSDRPSPLVTYNASIAQVRKSESIAAALLGDRDEPGPPPAAAGAGAPPPAAAAVRGRGVSVSSDSYKYYNPSSSSDRLQGRDQRAFQNVIIDAQQPRREQRRGGGGGGAVDEASLWADLEPEEAGQQRRLADPLSDDAEHTTSDQWVKEQTLELRRIYVVLRAMLTSLSAGPAFLAFWWVVTESLRLYRSWKTQQQAVDGIEVALIVLVAAAGAFLASNALLLPGSRGHVAESGGWELPASKGRGGGQREWLLREGYADLDALAPHVREHQPRKRQ